MAIRRRTLSRLAFLFAAVFAVRMIFFPASPSSSNGGKTKQDNYEIKEHNFIERATTRDKTLNVQKHSFLQARMGRDSTEDMFDELISNGIQDYWERFQMP
jgi:hypothetical protein